jgi:type IX secretion system PorP/SprF family membrane protein
LTLNPALTSAYKEIQGTLNYKQQWRSVKAYRTEEATFEMKLNQKTWAKLDKYTEAFKKKLMKGLALGVNFFTDKAGDGGMRILQGNLSVAYHAALSAQNTLSAAIMGGLVQRSMNEGGLRWNSQYLTGVYDPTAGSGEGFGNASYIYGDYAAGILFSHGKESAYMTSNDQKFFNMGASVYHLTQPNQSFMGGGDRLYMRYNFHTNVLLGIKNTNFSLAPSALFMRQGPTMEITFGAMIKYKLKEESKYTGIVKNSVFSAGCFYRNNDAVIPYVLIEMDKYSLGISYDTNISGLKTATTGRGGIEISLRINNSSPFLYQNSKSRM